MRKARAALALLLAFAVPVRAETTTDPLWYLLSTYVLAPDAKAVEAAEEGPADAKGLAVLQADFLLLSDGFESFRDESQVKETLVRLEPRMSPELRPFFKDRTSSLDAIYRTLAVTDYTWAQRFPEPPCAPIEARRKLLDSRDGLFQTKKGEASPWLVALLGPRAEGKSAEQALDQASSQARLTGAEYEKLRARVRKLTLALASGKAIGAARSKLYCSRAAAFDDLAGYHRHQEKGNTLASRAAVRAAPESSVFVVVWNSRRAAATLVATKSGPVLLTDASVVQDTDHPQLLAFSEKAKPLELTATVTRRDAALGLAVLKYFEDLPRPTLALADKIPSKDDLVSAIGHTEVSGLWTKASGLVTKSGPETFQTDAAVSSDFSGGPVLNESGEVAGLLVLRPADTEEGRWPVAVPASAIARWLDGAALAVVPATEAIEDAGTAAILSRTRPSALTDTGLPAWEISKLPPPPSEPRGVCMNCSSSNSPSRSYSSNSGGYSSSGGKELGEALGELGLVLILKGIPALFRGIRKLFKGNGASAPKDPPKSLAKAVPATTTKPKPPAPPPKPECKLIKVAAPAKAGADPFAVSVGLSCNDLKIPLSGHSVTFAFDWDGKPSTQTVTVPTDASGAASLVMQVSNDETKVEKVRDVSQRSHDELDHYDPDKRDPEEPGAPVQEETASATLQGSVAGPIEAAESVAPEKALIGTIAATGASGAAVESGQIFILVGKGSALRVTATIALGPVATGVLVLVTAKQVFDIGWAIGNVVDRKSSEVQWGLKQYAKINDCALKPNESILDRFIDGTGLAPGFLHAHEGHGHGHTIERHVRKTLDYLHGRLVNEPKVFDANSFDDHETAETAIRDAIMGDIADITRWGSRRDPTLKKSYLIGKAGKPFGYGIEREDSLSKARLKYNAEVRMLQKANCDIFILSAFPY